MFSVKVQTSDGDKEFTAKSFYQIVMGEGRLKVVWTKDNGENEEITYSRIRTIVEKKVELK